jgi:hypothetical protein
MIAKWHYPRDSLRQLRAVSTLVLKLTVAQRQASDWMINQFRRDTSHSPLTCRRCPMERRAIGVLELLMARIIAFALAAGVCCGPIAEAATCLSSAADVRKQQPKAWPKWTYGPEGERCWYAGKKPVFAKAKVGHAKAQSQPREAPSAELTPTTPPSPPLQSQGRNNNIPQSWDLEYRWPK